jgi:hypothetical protein
LLSLLRSPLGLIVGLITTAVVGVVVVAGVIGALAVTGGPAPCTPGGGPITVDDANAQSFDTKFASLNASSDAGHPTTVVLNESEVTSRADQYVRDHGVHISNIRVCIHDEFGEVTGSVDTVAGLTTDFRVTGTVNLTDNHPVVTFKDVEVGNVPGFVLSPFRDDVESVIRDEMKNITLPHVYLPGLTEGQAEIGSPDRSPRPTQG